MQHHMKLPLPALSVSSRSIRPHGILSQALRQAHIQRNDRFTQWCRKRRKWLGASPKQAIRAIVKFKAHECSLVLE